MREGIHPEYKATKIACACGNVVETRSTKGDFHVEICSACHPFFTGKQKLMDTAGRIEKFKTRYAAMPAAKPEVKAAPAPAPTSGKKIETRAEKRAKVNAGKPKPLAKAVEPKPTEERPTDPSAPVKDDVAKA